MVITRSEGRQEPERDIFRSRFSGSSIIPESPIVHFHNVHMTSGDRDGEYGAAAAAAAAAAGRVKMVDVSREELDAKLDRNEAKLEAALSKMQVEMASFREQTSARLDKLPSRSFMVGTVGTVVAVIVAAFALMAAQFGNGVMVTTASVDRASEAQQLAEQNAEQINTLSGDMADVLEELRAMRTAAPPADR